MIAAGEAGGILDTILDRLAIYIEKAVKLKGQVTSAMIYPVAVLTIAMVVVGVILWKVIPTFAALFSGLGAELPLPTRIVVAPAKGSSRWLPWLRRRGRRRRLRTQPVCRHSRRPAGSWTGAGSRCRCSDRSCGRSPSRGSAVRSATLIGSGVPILDGLAITASTCGNAVVEDALLSTRRSIERGETMAAPLQQTAVFPPIVVQMIGVGEATGALDTMLAKIAEFYEDEADTAVAGLVALLEPLLVGFLGLVVGGIVIAMYLPMFDLIGKLAR